MTAARLATGLLLRLFLRGGVGLCRAVAVLNRGAARRLWGALLWTYEYDGTAERDPEVRAWCERRD